MNEQNELVKKGYVPEVRIDNLKGGLAVSLWKDNHRPKSVETHGTVEDVCKAYPIVSDSLLKIWDKVECLYEEYAKIVKEEIEKGRRQ